MLWSQHSLLCGKCQGSFLLRTSNAEVNNKCNCTSAVPFVCLSGVLLLCLVGLLYCCLVNCKNYEAYERDLSIADAVVLGPLVGPGREYLLCLLHLSAAGCDGYIQCGES